MVIPTKKHVFLDFIKNWFAGKPLKHWKTFETKVRERREKQIQGTTIAGLISSPGLYP
jgi:hypothetical protein